MRFFQSIDAIKNVNAILKKKIQLGLFLTIIFK